MKHERLLSTLIAFALLFTASLSPMAAYAQGDTTGVTATTTGHLNVRARCERERGAGGRAYAKYYGRGADAEDQRRWRIMAADSL